MKAAGNILHRLLVVAFLASLTRASLYSSPDSAFQFSQCILGKMKESPQFSEDDCDSAEVVVDTMAQSMRRVNVQQRGSRQIKVLLNAFISSVAEVVTDANASTIFLRREAYISALAQCCTFAIGYVDQEFMEEALKIMATIENIKIRSSFVAPGFDRQVAGNPALGFAATPNFRQLANPALQNAPRPAPNNFQFGSAPSGIEALPYGIFQPGSNIPGTSRVTSFDSDGFVQPEAKGSRATVIPQKSTPSEGKSATILEAAAPETDITDFDIYPTEFSSDTFKLASGTTKAEIPDMYDDTNRPLDEVIANLLSDSSSFIKTFSLQEDSQGVINLAKKITEQGLSEYNALVINSALNAVAEATAETTFDSPKDFAIAVSKVLSSVLKSHDQLLLADGEKIANQIIQYLNNQERNSEKESDSGDSSGPSADDDSKVALEYDFGPLYVSRYKSEDVGGAMFCRTLKSLLADSEETSSFFCTNRISNKIIIYFSVVKASLAEFGPSVSSVAASAVSTYLSELSENSLCVNYADAISDAIADVLDEGGLISNANAQQIKDNMEYNLRQLLANVQPVESKADQSDDSNVSNISSANDRTTTSATYGSKDTTSDESCETITGDNCDSSEEDGSCEYSSEGDSEVPSKDSDSSESDCDCEDSTSEDCDCSDEADQKPSVSEKPISPTPTQSLPRSRPEDENEEISELADSIFAALEALQNSSSPAEDTVPDITVLQPSFQIPEPLSGGVQPTEISHNAPYSSDEKLKLKNIAQKMHYIAANGIALIKSQDFNLDGLCKKLNEFAAIVQISPVTEEECNPLSIVDYLLYVIKSVVVILTDI